MQSFYSYFSLFSFNSTFLSPRFPLLTFALAATTYTIHNFVTKLIISPDSRQTGLPPGNANFAELQIKTGRFMFFITRLTENTNLAVTMPASEQAFNSARVNIQLASPRFAALDIATGSHSSNSYSGRHR